MRKLLLPLAPVFFIAVGLGSPTELFAEGASRSPQSQKNPRKTRKKAKGRSNPTELKSNSKLSLRSATIGGSLSRAALPKSSALSQSSTNRPKAVGSVKPPRSSSFYDQGTKEADYEKLLDREIGALYSQSLKSKKSPNRGDIWLRLAERYVEKAKLVEQQVQSDYDKQVQAYLSKRTRVKPKLNTSLTREYHRKAIQLYEWFVADFPNDSRLDQALFFLGYNHFEIGNTQRGEEYYKQLTVRYPNSVYITESQFALGEFYFENDNWKTALGFYTQVIRARRARLASFAHYKAAWCQYRLGRPSEALKSLERVIRLSRSSDGSLQVEGRKSVNRVRLAVEALKDYVPFYAERSKAEDAYLEFKRVSGDERAALQMLEKLAYIYADRGSRSEAVKAFRQLIASDPIGERAAEYQYQIVNSLSAADPVEYRKQLGIWVDSFGRDSEWAKQNAKNQKLLADMDRLQEVTLRNHVLTLHQTAQNSRAKYSQGLALTAYQQYAKSFENAEAIGEMQFFHAELLFDMGRYSEAAFVYSLAAERSVKNEDRERALLNAVLSLEKVLPTPAQIDAKRGKSVTLIPFEPDVQKFEEAALKYTQAYPKSAKTPDIERRLGVLYYGYNSFDRAIPLFEKTLYANPSSENGEIAGNLILDIYKLKDDMIGLADKGQQFLAHPPIARSRFGAQIRNLIEKARYTKAEKLAQGGDARKAAVEFEGFAKDTQSPDLQLASRFKAAEAFERAGDIEGAQRNYQFVLASSLKDARTLALKVDARNQLAKIYQQTGQLEKAASQYSAVAQSNVKDQKLVNGFFNAAVIYDAVGMTALAAQHYDLYRQHSRRSDRIETLFVQAEMHRRKGQITKASELYLSYLQSPSADSLKRLEALFWRADILRKKGDAASADRALRQLLAQHRSATAVVKEGGARFASEARFQMALPILSEMRAIRFGRTDASQGAAAKRITQLTQSYLGEMKEVVRYNYGPMIVAALSSTGKMYDILATSFEKVLPPTSLSGDQILEYKKSLQREADRFRSEGLTSYQAALQRSQEFEVYGDWTDAARRSVERLDSSRKPDPALIMVTSDVGIIDWMGQLE